jgi:hypothetical protein
LADKNFKVKNGLTISGLTGGAGPLIADSNKSVDSTSSIPTQYGGTGTTTSPVSGEFLYSSGGTTYSPSSLSSTVPLWSPISVSSNITLSKWNNYMVDTSSARTLTLPASPSSADEIHIFDITGSAATNKITVSSNSNKINGTVQDLEIDANNAAVVLIYTGSIYGWRVS